MTEIDRRTLLRLGGVAAAGTLAGCTGGEDGDDGATTATTTETTSTATTTTTETTTTTPQPRAEGSPGADVVGGPDDLLPEATVLATVLDEDRGAGRFVNTPAVVWVESGATVTWEIEGASHSATAYHPDGGKPLRIPEDATPFDTRVLNQGATVEHTFETPGVYNYYCIPHEALGMVGMVIVEENRGGPGTTDPEDLEDSGARSAINELLRVIGEE